jgi:AcrR family transcriptional regulator
MANTRDPGRTKTAILTAAESLIAAKGIHALTLEDVAAGASVSKGGLLHHFANKQALIAGLAERMIAEHEEEVESYRKQDPALPGSFTRAFLRTNLAFADECTQVCALMTAESRNYPAMRELFQRYGEQCQHKIENDGLDPVVGSVIRYAVEGLLWAAMWGMSRPATYSEIVTYLLNLAGAKPAVTKKIRPQ